MKIAAEELYWIDIYNINLSLLFPSSNYYAMLVRVLDVIIGSSSLGNNDILLIVKVKDKALSSSVELATIPPFFTAINTKHSVIIVPNENNSVVS